MSSLNTIGAVIGVALGLLWTSDVFRMRGRASSMPILPASEEPVSDSHEFLVRDGVTLDDRTKRAASAYARANKLDVLDLVAPNISSWRAAVLLLMVDPRRYVTDRIAGGASACDATLVTKDVLARAHEGSKKQAPKSAPAFIDFVRVLKRYAASETGIAAAPTLVTTGIAFAERRRMLRVVFSEHVAPIIAAQFALLGFAVAFAPRWSLYALVLWHLQVFLATIGTPLRPSDRFVYPFIRFFVDVASSFGKSTGATQHDISSAALRPVYKDLLAQGTARFFQERREDCPLCHEKSLSKMIEMSDRHQGKPGRFRLDRCDACGFVFQNPRLSIDGLSFYYRDFYDGLGEEKLESVFASGPGTYLARARMVEKITSPESWLDVGAGHGHFCSQARAVFPKTRFDGLDMSESIADAERRRWIDHGIRGLFPEVAASLATERGHYDVVSMSHYLEHTLDPRAEIAAAKRVLKDDGHLFIELPDPESKIGRLLGRSWLPWFQPQHIGLLTVKNLEAILRENSFEPVTWHRGEAHQPCDLMFAAYMGVERVAPDPELPWSTRGGFISRVWRAFAWTIFFPIIGIAWLTDKLIAPLVRRPGWSNTYRVVAKRSS